MKILQDRKSVIHLIDYSSPISNRKYTVCGKLFSKLDIINLLSLDSVISCICKNCYTENTLSNNYQLSKITNKYIKSPMQYNLLVNKSYQLSAMYDEYMVDNLKFGWSKLTKYMMKYRNK